MKVLLLWGVNGCGRRTAADYLLSQYRQIRDMRAGHGRFELEKNCVNRAVIGSVYNGWLSSSKIDELMMDAGANELSKLKHLIGSVENVMVDAFGKDVWCYALCNKAANIPRLERLVVSDCQHKHELEYFRGLKRDGLIEGLVNIQIRRRSVGSSHSVDHVLEETPVEFIDGECGISHMKEQLDKIVFRY